jgi:hypothetical protein
VGVIHHVGGVGVPIHSIQFLDRRLAYEDESALEIRNNGRTVSVGTPCGCAFASDGLDSSTVL